MKKILFSIMALGLFISCQNELYRDNAEIYKSEQGSYISESNAQVFVKDGDSQDIRKIRLSLALKPERDITVSVVAGDASVLADYNKKNGTNYELLPKEMYEAASSVTFPAQTSTVVYPVSLKKVKFKPGTVYALPVSLVGGNAIPGQRVGLIVVEPLTVTKVIRFNGSGSEDGKMWPEVLKVKQWTMEMMIRRSAYDRNNRALGGTKGNSNGSIDEIYTRFGDVVIDPDQLQMKTASSNLNVPKDKLSAKPNEWYMLSFVYDGVYNKIYVNGNLAYSAIHRENNEYGLTGFWLSGNNEYIREFRFYKVAKTEQQIANSTWKMADYDDPNLLVYYPMNGKKLDRESGNTIVEDETKIWDWSKNQKHLNLPSGAKFMNDANGQPFVFPLQK